MSPGGQDWNKTERSLITERIKRVEHWNKPFASPSEGFFNVLLPGLTLPKEREIMVRQLAQLSPQEVHQLEGYITGLLLETNRYPDYQGIANKVLTELKVDVPVEAIQKHVMDVAREAVDFRRERNPFPDTLDGIANMTQETRADYAIATLKAWESQGLNMEDMGVLQELSSDLQKTGYNASPDSLLKLYNQRVRGREGNDIFLPHASDELLDLFVDGASIPMTLEKEHAAAQKREQRAIEANYKAQGGDPLDLRDDQGDWVGVPEAAPQQQKAEAERMSTPLLRKVKQ